MGDGERARLDVGEDAQNRVFARGRVDMDTVTRDPDKELRFGLHRGVLPRLNRALAKLFLVSCETHAFTQWR